MAKGFKTKKNKAKREWDEGLSALNRNAAGIHVGNAEHYVAVPAGRDPEPVKVSEASRQICIAWRNG